MKKAFEPLFETLKLPNGLELRNRFVLAPLTHESSNDDGTINDDNHLYGSTFIRCESCTYCCQ